MCCNRRQESTVAEPFPSLLLSTLSIFIFWTLQDNAVRGLGKNCSPPINLIVDVEDGTEAEGDPVTGACILKAFSSGGVELLQQHFSTGS